VAAIVTEMRALQEIIAKFKAIQVDATEYACLKGIVLFKTGKRRGHLTVWLPFSLVALLDEKL